VPGTSAVASRWWVKFTAQHSSQNRSVPNKLTTVLRVQTASSALTA
jgi:hypothetical protein